MALLLVGEEQIASEDDGSKLADVASTFIDLCIETAISEDDWMFARKRTSLSALTTVPAFGFSAAFELPPDYNHIYIEEGSEFEYREEGHTILADAETLDLIYIANISDVNLFKPKFLDAVVTLLASKIAYSASANLQLAATLEQLYEKRLLKAKTENSKGYGIIPETDTWIEDR